jgi:hypothetical protein
LSCCCRTGSLLKTVQFGEKSLNSFQLMMLNLQLLQRRYDILLNA